MIDYNWQVPKPRDAQYKDLKEGANKSEIFYSSIWKSSHLL